MESCNRVTLRKQEEKQFFCGRKILFNRVQKNIEWTNSCYQLIIHHRLETRTKEKFGSISWPGLRHVLLRGSQQINCTHDLSLNSLTGAVILPLTLFFSHYQWLNVQVNPGSQQNWALFFFCRCVLFSSSTTFTPFSHHDRVKQSVLCNIQQPFGMHQIFKNHQGSTK